MMKDSVLNMTVGILLSLVVVSFILVGRHNAVENAEKLTNLIGEMTLISEKIREFRDEYPAYHVSFEENRMANLLGGIPTKDPFDPESRDYRYRITDEGWVVYSVGPNGTDDGGVASHGEKVLDIVVEGRRDGR